jgi:hypothetical protein
MTNLSAYRFSRSDLTLKPGKVSGERALCLVYADTRAYQNALDSASVNWDSTVQAVGPKAVIVALSIDGVTRSATGEDDDLMSAEARAFKRACSAFGLGRYIYAIDLGFQPFDGKRFGPAAAIALDKVLRGLDVPAATDEAKPWQTWQGPQNAYTWAVDTGAAQAIPHARNALQKLVVEQFDGHMTMTNWPTVAAAYYHERLARLAEKSAA